MVEYVVLCGELFHYDTRNFVMNLVSEYKIM